jgi:hypothetical protein
VDIGGGLTTAYRLRFQSWAAGGAFAEENERAHHPVSRENEVRQCPIHPEEVFAAVPVNCAHEAVRLPTNDAGCAWRDQAGGTVWGSACETRSLS